MLHILRQKLRVPNQIYLNVLFGEILLKQDCYRNFRIAFEHFEKLISKWHWYENAYQVLYIWLIFRGIL